MPAEVRITDDDIVFAENILFSDGEKFDDERIVFIKNLNTIDLQAVPGSGKTTALIAKLLILERHLPFDDGSGVLVISHTNAAIDEIRRKIGRYCPKLFSYPNFVGTIQGFVDQFLAIPYYVLCYKAKPCRIDGDIYNDRAEYYYFQLASPARGWVERKNKPTKFFQALRFDVSLNITNGINGQIELRAENKSDTYQQIRNLKSNMVEDGYLHFDDAYFLAGRYMAKMPKLVKLLQNRFRFVFVDEMQDMEKHQHDLLERIFFDNANSVSKYQRIGDKNQAIYSGKVTLDGIWSERETLTINGSHRLTPPIAELVNCFALHRDAGFQVRGLRRLRNGEISPHLIVYDDTNIGDVIRKYSEIINGLVTEEKIPSSETGSEGIKSRFKAIAWRKNPPGENKIGISDYFPGFDVVNHNTRIDYSYLENYLNTNHKTENALAPIQANIINALLKVLRLENIETEKERKYTKYSLFAYLKEHHESSLDELRLKLFQWSMALARGKDIKNLVRAYIPNLLNLFDGVVDHSDEFINEEDDNGGGGIVREGGRNLNVVNYHDFDIHITTVHAEKGKTHTATLYMETYYCKDGRGENAKSYESQRLSEQFKGSYLTGNEGDRVKQSAKMVYVGISRPTHLLCIAVHKDRFDEYLSDIDAGKWEVEHLS